MIDVGKHDLTANVSSAAGLFNHGATWRTVTTVVLVCCCGADDFLLIVEV
jgi:hypothetical protein